MSDGVNVDASTRWIVAVVQRITEGLRCGNRRRPQLCMGLALSGLIVFGAVVVAYGIQTVGVLG
ncbi:MAG: hypothetical protein PPP55_00340 [Halorubrum sp.]